MKLKMLLKMMLGGYTCRDTERLLFDFAEGRLDARSQRKLEAHLADCPECLEFVRTYRRTIAVTHQHGWPAEAEMPARLRAKLRQFLAESPDLK